MSWDSPRQTPSCWERTGDFASDRNRWCLDLRHFVENPPTLLFALHPQIGHLSPRTFDAAPTRSAQRRKPWSGPTSRAPFPANELTCVSFRDSSHLMSAVSVRIDLSRCAIREQQTVEHHLYMAQLQTAPSPLNQPGLLTRTAKHQRTRQQVIAGLEALANTERC